MTASRPVQVAWSSGEIDPLLHQREDYQRHQTGLALCNGFIPLRQGGITRAPGTIRRGTTRGNAPARRIPFVFNETDACSLEFSAGKMRVWRYGDLVEKDGAPYEIDTPWLESDLPELGYMQDADVMYLVDGRNPVQQLSRFALDDWTLAPAAFDFGPFQPENTDDTLRLQVSNTGTGAVQQWVADEVLTIGTLRKRGTNVYSFAGRGSTEGAAADGGVGVSPPTHSGGTEGYAVDDEGPPGEYAFWAFEYASTSNVGDIVTLTASGGLFTADHAGVLLSIEPTDWLEVALWVGNYEFSRGQIMRYGDNLYRYTGGNDATTGVNPPVHTEGTVKVAANESTKAEFLSTTIGVLRITSVISATEAEAVIVQAVPEPCFDSPTYRWAIGAWNDLAGYPRHIALHEQRLVAARTPSEPRTITFSTSGAYRDFAPSDQEDGSFSYDIGGISSKNDINWLISGRRGVYIGSMGGVRLGYSGGSEPITLTSFSPEVVSTDGAARVQPVIPFGWPIYITRDKGRVQEIRYSFAEDASRPLELSLPSQHLGGLRFEQIVWQRAPYNRGWLRLGDGTIACLIYDPDQDVLGWARCSVAGGVVEDLEICPSVDGSFDILTMIVRRELGGETVRCVEEQALNFAPMTGAAGVEAFNHAFCGSVFMPETETDSFSVPHLAGETVNAWTDRGEFAGLEVAGDGTVTLPDPVTSAIIGLVDETHLARSLPLRAAARDGDSRGRKRRLMKKSALMLHRSVAGYARIIERIRAGDVHAAPRAEILPPLVLSGGVAERSGIIELEIQSGTCDEVSIQFEPAGLSPLTITGLVPAIEEVNA